jgi:hypothetical protein
MCGYQGWFAAEGDGSGLKWRHYDGNRDKLTPGACSFDLWPDLAEFSQDEKFPTAFRHADGSVAHLFSSNHPKTVRRHFEWMRTYGIDGVFLQRFATSLKTKKLKAHRDLVTSHVRAASKATDRSWAMMYDLSGLREGDVATVLIPDWERLTKVNEITKDPSYLHHKGKPLVAVWGIGFSDDRRYTLNECARLVRHLKKSGCTVMIGIPSFWRDLHRDSLTDKRLHDIIAQADVISPWTVGRYRSPKGAASHAEDTWRPDLRWASKREIDYLPVIFPGFSWQNLQASKGEKAELNDIPRLKGQFLWTQATAAKKIGANMLYVAMFDEIDEGTAIFKCSNNPPIGSSKFATYEGLPSDHYLWLTGQITRMIRGEVPTTPQAPKRSE